MTPDQVLAQHTDNIEDLLEYLSCMDTFTTFTLLSYLQECLCSSDPLYKAIMPVYHVALAEIEGVTTK